MDKFFDLIWAQMPRILSSILVLIIGLWLISWVNRLVKRFLQKSRIEPSLWGFLRTTIKVVLQIALIITALDILGLPMGNLATLLGGAAVAIGLALRDSLANVASGLLILLTKPFVAGDYIETGDQGGSVQEIQVMNTLLKTPDGKRLIIPNSILTRDRITNFSVEKLRRIELKVVLDHTQDPEAAMTVLRDVLTPMPWLLQAPPFRIGVTRLELQGTVLVLWAWCESGGYVNNQFQLTEAVKTAFDQNKILLARPFSPPAL